MHNCANFIFPTQSPVYSVKDQTIELLSQPNDRSTAIFHLLYLMSRSSSEIFGLNEVQLLSTLTFSTSQQPTARPAAIAAPCWENFGSMYSCSTNTQ